jgi:hypothetical protein
MTAQMRTKTAAHLNNVALINSVALTTVNALALKHIATGNR